MSADPKAAADAAADVFYDAFIRKLRERLQLSVSASQIAGSNGKYTVSIMVSLEDKGAEGHEKWFNVISNAQITLEPDAWGRPTLRAGF